MFFLENRDVTVVWRLEADCGLEILEPFVAVFKIGQQFQVVGVQNMSPDVVEGGDLVIVLW